MEFKQLRSFLEVVHRGGFTQAALTLHISQSAVSKQVAQLEQDLGVPLLERQGSQLHLTAAGKIVLERGEAMLRLRQELLSELDDLSQLARGELRLGLPLLGSDALFARLFAEYRRRYPNISIQLFEGGSRSVEQAVLSGELELGGSLTPSDPVFAYQPFCNEPLDALLPTDHPLAPPAGSAWHNWPIHRSCSISAVSCSMTVCSVLASSRASRPGKVGAAARPTFSPHWWRQAKGWCCYRVWLPEAWSGLGWCVWH